MPVRAAPEANRWFGALGTFSRIRTAELVDPKLSGVKTRNVGVRIARGDSLGHRTVMRGPASEHLKSGFSVLFCVADVTAV
jgi:hypothetical protein